MVYCKIIIYGKFFAQKYKLALKKILILLILIFQIEIGQYLYMSKEMRNKKVKKTVNYCKALNLSFKWFIMHKMYISWL